jgi:radical SAM superfamily enzyme YgiQ (UPF0313 family)
LNIFLLDVYKKCNFRVSKDTNGGFGTGNEFGKGIFPSLLTYIKKKSTDFPPLYLAYLSGVLRSKGHKVLYGRNKFPPKDTDIVLLSSSIVEHNTELEWGKLLKSKNYKNIGYVGPFATVMADEYLKVGDFVVLGEPEFYFHANQIKLPLKGKLVNNKAIHIDQLPFPDWDIFNIKNLRYGLYGGGGVFFPMLASRGCPHSCRYYCTYPLQQGTTLRNRSAKNIVDEIEYLKKRYNLKTILFRDPVFSMNRKRTIEFADELIKRKLNVKFVIETHLNYLDDELVDKLKKAGLITIKIGVETPNKDILDNNNRKGIMVDTQEEKIRKIEKKGVKVICFYMLGFMQDTWESCIKTIEYAKKINSAGAQFSILTPYPGTKFYEDIKERIFEKNFDNFTQFRLVYKQDSLNPKQIEKLKNIAYSTYYLRLSLLFKYIKMRFFNKKFIK